MKKTNVLIILMWLISNCSYAQIDIPDTWDGSDGRHPQSPIDPGNPTEVDLDLPLKPKKTEDRGGGRDTRTEPLKGNYDGPASDALWGENDTYSNGLYERKKANLGLEKRIAVKEALGCIEEMERLLIDNCIDTQQLLNVIDEYNKLSDSQKSYLGSKGKNTCEKMLNQLKKAEPLYNKYSLMATKIKLNSFSSIDKDIMSLPYESQNEYLKQFLTKEDFDKAKVEFDKYEKDKTAKEAIEKIKHHKMHKKEKTTGEVNYNLTLQKVRYKEKYAIIKTTNKYFEDEVMIVLPNFIPEYQVGAMVFKTASDKEKQLSDMIGEEFVPKNTLLDKVSKGINTVNKANSYKELLIKSFLGDWEGTMSGFGEIVKEEYLNPLKDCANGLGSSFTGSYEVMKRVFNFKETMTTLVNDTWNGVENAIREAERGNINTAWRIIFRTEQKDLNTTKKGIKNQ